MSYGIFDCDMRLYERQFFNLELMKLSSYYKKQGQLVSCSLQFQPEYYGHYIIGKDYIDEKFNYPVYKYDNIITTGRAFAPRKYPPMDLTIEKQKPDTYIYEKVIKTKTPFLKEIDKRKYRKMLNGEHFRLSLNGTEIWQDFTKQLRHDPRASLYVYDYDLGDIKDSFFAIKELYDFYSRYRNNQLDYLSIKFPITIKKMSDIFDWLNFRYSSNIIFNFNFKIDESIEETKKYTSSNKCVINYDFTKFMDYNYFIKDGVNELYEQLYFLRTLPPVFLLKCEQEFFEDYRWYQLIQYFNRFIRSYNTLKQKFGFEAIKKDTLYSYTLRCAKNHRIDFNTEEIRNLFLFVKEANYPLFKKFYEYKVE